jgi:hypothetical protein
MDPEDSPQIITLAEAPPNEAILSTTHYINELVSYLVQRARVARLALGIAGRGFMDERTKKPSDLEGRTLVKAKIGRSISYHFLAGHEAEAAHTIVGGNINDSCLGLLMCG